MAGSFASQMHARGLDHRLAWVGLGGCLLAAMAFVASPGFLPNAIGTLVHTGGDARIDGESAAAWTKIPAGARVDALRGGATVQLGEATLRLAEGARLELASEVEATLGHGLVRVDQPVGARALRLLAGGAELRFASAQVSIERTRTDDRVLVAVRSGEVRLSSLDGVRTLGPGEKVTLVRGHVSRAPWIADSGGVGSEASAPTPKSRRADGKKAAGALQDLKKRAGRLVDDWTR